MEGPHGKCKPKVICGCAVPLACDKNFSGEQFPPPPPPPQPAAKLLLSSVHGNYCGRIVLLLRLPLTYFPFLSDAEKVASLAHYPLSLYLYICMNLQHSSVLIRTALERNGRQALAQHLSDCWPSCSFTAHSHSRSVPKDWDTSQGLASGL